MPHSFYEEKVQKTSLKGQCQEIAYLNFLPKRLDIRYQIRHSCNFSLQ